MNCDLDLCYLLLLVLMFQYSIYNVYCNVHFEMNNLVLVSNALVRFILHACGWKEKALVDF